MIALGLIGLGPQSTSFDETALFDDTNGSLSNDLIVIPLPLVLGPRRPLRLKKPMSTCPMGPLCLMRLLGPMELWARRSLLVQ